MVIMTAKERIDFWLGIGDGKESDHHTLLIIILAKALVGVLAFSELFIKGYDMDIRLLALGIVIFIIGTLVRVWGHLSLGKQFTIAVKIVPNHKLITTGPHRYMRHPMYTGLFMMILGAGIAMQSVWGVVATFVVLLPAGLYRVKIEEDVLLKNFGKQYADYMKKTKRFVPYMF
jgi:protein-S-isoprenylcysteine O-methyltransferase Ste14